MCTHAQRERAREREGAHLLRELCVSFQELLLLEGQRATDRTDRPTPTTLHIGCWFVLKHNFTWPV